tara:strand:+ start:420 stop:944 length:525 start_codon:yes stop_codon:yes gene_type:complete
MDVSVQKLKSVIIKSGLYFGLTVVAFNFITAYMGLSDEFSMTIIGFYYAVFFTTIFIIIPLSQYNFKRLNNGILSLSEAMKLGLGILLIGLLIIIFSQLIIWEFITDQGQFIISTENAIKDNIPPEMLTDEILEEAREDIKKQFSFRSITVRIMTNLFLISIYTLITGLALKNK